MAPYKGSKEIKRIRARIRIRNPVVQIRGSRIPYQNVTDPQSTPDIPHSLLTSHGIVHGEGLQLPDGGILEGTELRQQRHIGRTVRHHVGVRRLGQVHVNRVQGVHAGRPGVVAQRITLIRCVMVKAARQGAQASDIRDRVFRDGDMRTEAKNPFV
jgi:hypothetical protein